MAKNMEITLFLDFYGDMLTEKQRDVVDLYYNNDLSLSEIAENYGITRQGVRDTIKRAEAQLTGMEQQLGLIKRFRAMQDGFQRIHQAAEAIRALNDRYGYSRDIEEQASLITVLASQLAQD